MSSPKLDPNLIFLRRLFTCSFLTFRPDDKDTKISKWRLIPMILFMLIAFYNLLYVFYCVISSLKQLSSNNFMIFSLVFQAFVCMCLIIRWQFGPFQFIFDMKTWAQFGYPIFSSPQTKKRLILTYLVFGLISFIIFCFLFYIILLYFIQTTNRDLLPGKIVEGFGSGTVVIGLILIAYFVFILIATFLFYTIILNAMCEILRCFNEELKQFGKKTSNLDRIIQELSALYDKQVRLIVLLRQMNSTFEVFSFFMIGSTMIFTIFCSYTFCELLKMQSLLADLLYMPNVLICLLVLFGLTEPPSRIRSEIEEIEANTLLNQNIWASRNGELYQIGCMIIMNAKQQNVGISVWGFAMMSKSMILTVASLTATYLTIVLQMAPSSGGSKLESNSTGL